jgi:hypothetical protein
MSAPVRCGPLNTKILAPFAGVEDFETADWAVSALAEGEDHAEAAAIAGVGC